VKETYGWLLPTVLRPVGVKGFVVLPKRGVVVRTFAGLARCRRTTRDDEKTTLFTEAFVHLATIRLMARRLTRR
jgi:putative transposase